MIAMGSVLHKMGFLDLTEGQGKGTPTKENY